MDNLNKGVALGKQSSTTTQLLAGFSVSLLEYLSCIAKPKNLNPRLIPEATCIVIVHKHSFDALLVICLCKKLSYKKKITKNAISAYAYG